MDDILRQLVMSVLAALVPIIAGLVVAFLVRILQRVGLEVGAEQQAKIEKTVQDAVLRAEEWGARKLKGQLPVTSGDKLGHAIEEIVLKLPQLSHDQAVKLIDQELPKLKLGAAAGFQVARAATEPGR